ncbi:MAG: ABC transporter permease, partial [Deltaproteobacteria bacterium]|nr:ABC transporter permease [Deltaproteobacteria bacterium]
MINNYQNSTNEFLAPKRTRWQEFWQSFRQNRLAIVGLVIFALFFLVALAGLFLTSGQDPVFDPALVRLQEKLRPPLSRPNLDTLLTNEIPTLGVYVMGTDDLGRDVFARMLQGAWVGISVLVGIFMGGIAGYFGQNHIRLDHILMACFLFAAGIFLSMGATFTGLVFLFIVLASVLILVRSRNMVEIQGMSKLSVILRKDTISVDTLIMRIVDIMLCFPSFFLILTV